MRSTQAWLDTGERLSIPAAPMLTLEMLPDDPHLRAVHFFSTMFDASIGEVCFPGVPVNFDGKRPPIGFPPRLGEHGPDILGELGLPHRAPWARPAQKPRPQGQDTQSRTARAAQAGRGQSPARSGP